MKCLSRLIASLTLGASITIGLWQGIAQAADHLNLEEGLPLEVEDARPVPYGGREIQGVFRYERTDEGEDLFLVEPRVEYGFAPNWQGRISVPFLFGSAEEDGLGDIGLEVFYNFNNETLTLPAFSLSVNAELPTGPDSAGVDPTVKFIATKTLGADFHLDQLHLNLAYGLNDEPQSGERSDRFSAVLGYSRRVESDMTFLADFVYEQELEEGKDAYLLGLGLRRQITPLSVLAIGAGAGLSEDSPDFRITAGFQRSF